MIAAQSVDYVERFIFDAGHTVQRVEYDYGYDLLVSTFDEEGYEEPGLVYVQVKASEKLNALSGARIGFDIAIKDLNLWVGELMPVVLVVYDAQKRRAWWLYIQRYFAERARRISGDAKTVRVFIPLRQRFGPRTVSAMRHWKRNVLEQSWGKIGHA